MSSSTLITILSACGGVITGVLGFLGLQLSQRSARRAQQAALDIERGKVAAAAYTEARQIWDALIADLRTKAEDQKREISDLRREFAAQHAEIGLWRKRLEDLEHKRAGDRHAIHVLTVYARELLRVIQDNDLTPPQPPEGLDLQG